MLQELSISFLQGNTLLGVGRNLKNDGSIFMGQLGQTEKV